MSHAGGGKVGSYPISVGAGVGGAICLTLTGIILHEFGKQYGADLLSWANVAVHILGFVFMGLAVGYFLNPRNLGWAIPCALIMILAGAVTFTNLYGYYSAVRIAATKAVEDAEARTKQRADDRRAQAKARLDAQQQLAKTQLGFMQSEVRDASGREKKALSKDFGKNAAAIIAEIGKETPQAPIVEEAAKVNPDEGTAELARIAGISQRSVVAAMAMAVAALLVALEMMLWPMASYTWPRKLQASEGVPAAPPAPAPSPVSVLGPEPLPDTPVAEPLLIEPPKPVRKPGPRRAHLPEATPFLEEIDFPLRDLAGPLRRKEDTETSAKRFLVWLQCCGLCSDPTPTEEIEALYVEFCEADHRDPAAIHLVKGDLKKLKPVYWGKPTQEDGSRPPRWTIKPARFPKPTAEKDITPSHPKQEGGEVVAFNRPLAEAPAHEPASVDASDTSAKRVVEGRKSRHVQFEHPVLNAARAHWMRRDARNFNRKQRGSRMGRRAA